MFMRMVRTSVRRPYVARKMAVATVVIAGLLQLAAGSVENVKADPTTACTYGLSSLGPVFFRNGRVIGGSTTPTTEACLP